MKTENLSIGLRVLYHAIEWLTVFLILLIFAVQIITPLYAVRVGRADSFLQQLQWLPYRPGVLALGVMLAAVGTILSKCSHEVDSGFLSRSSWQLYLLEGVLYSASALIFQQNCDKIALFAIVDMVDDPRSLRQKRFLSAMIVVYLFCNMDAATSALHAVTLKQYLAFYSLHTRSVLQLVIESLSALEMILFILYMVLFISQQTSEKQEILNLNQQLQQANEQLRIYAEESAHTAQVQERNRLAREIHDTLGHVLTGITAGADACIQMMDDSPEMARHQMELIADTARNGMNDVRRSVKALRPDSLEKENLSGALNKMCTSMAQSSGAQIQLEESLAGLTLSQDEEDCVYRTVQEGITNAIRHGHATRVQVRCHIEDGVLEVSVRDNGIGCKSVTPGFGLQHMQERMLMLGGTFWYENSDGFCIRAEIPLRKTPGSEKRKQEETGGNGMIKVLLADDQELIRQSLSFVMSRQEDIEMVGTAANGREALELVEEKQPDVVLLDIRMPEMDGVECTRRIKQEFPGIKVIILTTFDDDDYVFDALRYGASGYLLKGVSVDGLTNAVREAARGGSIIAPDVASKVLQMFSRMAQGDVQVRVNKKNALELTKMEWQVIREVGCGLSNKEIAGRLYLSEGTVRNYISSILRKLELRDRTQLAIWAVQNQNSQPEADV